ncbi:MAG: ACT domain-containing protein [Deltaproteobacteria bacterium]|nr:ACT domain-containing protein [Deltaproteobacteria bacterium]
MDKVVISVLGTDRPGIVAAVSKVLMERRCNVEDVTQTILQGEFVGILIATVPQGASPESLREELGRSLDPLGLRLLLKRLEPHALPVSSEASEPFVVVTNGPDRLGLVAGITSVMARFGVNITHLKAAFRGGDDPRRNTMIYEVDVPLSVDRKRFLGALQDEARALGLELSVQHRDIFETINRI